ncbi:hypothetical protein [Croceimicrobium sp.]|uniref:hypothetical protein n=1 Tax=Croceimicrobium sp. TaxID=2828340 RepID=UPI003BAB404E
MRLDYKIAWIDDEIEHFVASRDVERVEVFIRELGFIPYINIFNNGQSLDGLIDQCDLIISDFNIEEGRNGDDVIKEIREKDIFTEVLFYTSRQDNKNLIAQKLLGFDRISFHSGRRHLLDKIESLIKLSVKRLLDLNATRGLITSETSELDVIIHEITMHLIDHLKISKDEIEGIVGGYVEKKLKSEPDYMIQLYEEKGFEDFFLRMRAVKKWEIFRKFLKKIKDDKVVNSFLLINKTYQNEVIEVRNRFAHSKAIEENGSLILLGFGNESNYEFDEGSCVNIRKRLMIHREEFEKLKDHLKV